MRLPALQKWLGSFGRYGVEEARRLSEEEAPRQFAFDELLEQHQGQSDLYEAVGLPIGPGESVALWRNMASVGGDQPPEILSTHPGHQSRIEGLRAEMVQAKEVYRGVSPSRC